MPIAAIFKFFFSFSSLSVARAAVPQLPLPLNYHSHTDRQTDDGEACCVHEVLQFRDETNVLNQGGYVVAQDEEEVWAVAEPGSGSDRICVSMVVMLTQPECSFIRPEPLFIHLFIYLFILPLITLPAYYGCRLWTGIPSVF